MNFAPVDDTPVYFKDRFEQQFDTGQGIPRLDQSGMSIQDIAKAPFLCLQDHHRDFNSMAQTALQGVQKTSPLSNLFFSRENVERIQKKIKQGILQQTQGRYRLEVDQNVDDLLVVMRAVYMEHGRYLPNSLVRQVKKLNQKVVETVLPDMLTNIKQYYGYLKDINTPLQPMDLPRNVNNAGRKTLPSPTDRFENIWTM